MSDWIKDRKWLTEEYKLKGVLEVSFSLDGDKYCARIGENLQEGLAGFGDSPVKAMRELANEIERQNWNLPHITLW